MGPRARGESDGYVLCVQLWVEFKPLELIQVMPEGGALQGIPYYFTVAKQHESLQ